MKQVLEHTPDPRRALAEVHRLLRPEGALFVAIPDARYQKRGAILRAAASTCRSVAAPSTAPTTNPAR